MVGVGRSGGRVPLAVRRGVDTRLAGPVGNMFCIKPLERAGVAINLSIAGLTTLVRVHFSSRT